MNFAGICDASPGLVEAPAGKPRGFRKEVTAAVIRLATARVATRLDDATSRRRKASAGYKQYAERWAGRACGICRIRRSGLPYILHTAVFRQ